MTARFWRQLYHKYADVVKLPLTLQPFHVDAQSRALRVRVVRALHLGYAPFLARNASRVHLNSVSLSPVELRQLQAARCTGVVVIDGQSTATHEDDDPIWNYRASSSSSGAAVAPTPARVSPSRQYRLMFSSQLHVPHGVRTGAHGNNVVYRNDDEFCSQLTVMSTGESAHRPLAQPSINGKRVIGVHTTLNSDMRTYTYRMQLAERPLRARAIGTVVDVHITNVTALRLAHWWMHTYE